MKTKHTAIIIAAFICISAYKSLAQWIPVFQDVNTFYKDAEFPTDHTGYVIAFDTLGAVVLVTGDGGTSWTRKRINGWGYIDRIAMFDSLRGYLIKGGVPVQLLRTTDGFTTYTVRNLDSCFVVRDLQLLNDSTGLYLNNETRLRKFKNYGASYFHVFDTLFDGQNLQFLSPTTGFLDNGYQLLKTSDGGSTWNYVNTNQGFYTVVMKFADSLNGYFHDGTTIYKTSDGGSTFPQQYNFINPVSFAAKGNFCMAANNFGDVAYTTDNALTWQTESTGINWVANESYIVKNRPDGTCFIFSGNSGEIRMRQPVIAGITPFPGSKYFSFYPNPVKDKIMFISNATEEYEAFVRIIDVTGKILFSGKVRSGESLAVPEFISDGFYLIEMETLNQRFIRSLMVKRN